MAKKNNKLNVKTILLIFFILNSVNIIAQDEIPDSIIDERIQCIQQILNQGKTNANRWWYGWLVGYSAATVGQGAAYFASDDMGTKQDMALGAATCFLGAVGQVIMPLNPGKKAKILSQISDSTHEEKLKKLSTAEEMLKSIALAEKKGRSWQTHAQYTAINLASGLVTWLGFKRSVWAGIGNFAMNTAITETQIWTQPTKTMKDYQRYCQKYDSEISEYTSKSKPTIYFSAYTNGFVLRIVF